MKKSAFLPSLAMALAVCGVCLAGPALADAATTGRLLTLTDVQRQAMGIQVQAVQSRAMALGPYAATATLPPQRLRAVTAPWAGWVQSWHVKEGDAVRSGQVLATLTSPDGVEQSRQARIARSQAEVSRKALARDEALYKEGLIPLSRLEASRAQAAQAEWAQQGRQAAAQMPGVQWSGDRLLVLAPMAGTVMGPMPGTGERVDAGSALAQVGQGGDWQIELRVPVRDAGSVRVGQSVQVEGVDPAAKVSAVGLSVDGSSQTVLVRAQWGGPASGLRWGQGLSVKLLLDHSGAVGVPDGAVIDWQGQGAVWVELAPGRYQLRPVQQARRQGAQSTVQGLDAQARVVTRGAVALKAMLQGEQP